MKQWMAVAAVVCALAWPATSEASAIGISVDGSFTFPISSNNFDPANGFVPAGFGNSAPGSHAGVTVADPLVEFGFHSVASDGFGGFITTDATADFTAHQLIVTYRVAGDADLLAPWVMTFTSPDFAGFTLSEVSDTLDVTGVLQGTVLMVTWPALLSSGVLPTAVFDLESASVPEPATALLVAAGLVAAVRRRRHAPVVRTSAV